MWTAATTNLSRSFNGHIGTHFDVENQSFPLKYCRRKGWIFDVRNVPMDREITADDIDLSNVNLFRDGLAKYMVEHSPKLRSSVMNGKIDDATASRLRARIARFKKLFLAEHPNRRRMEDVEQAAEQTVSAPPEGGHEPLDGQGQ